MREKREGSAAELGGCDGGIIVLVLSTSIDSASWRVKDPIAFEIIMNLTDGC